MKWWQPAILLVFFIMVLYLVRSQMNSQPIAIMGRAMDVTHYDPIAGVRITIHTGESWPTFLTNSVGETLIFWLMQDTEYTIDIGWGTQEKTVVLTCPTPPSYVGTIYLEILIDVNANEIKEVSFTWPSPI